MAAGSLYLLVVMFFDYFDIELTAEKLCGCLSKVCKQVDAQRHIEREEHGNLLCCGLYLCYLLIGEACGCDNNGSACGKAVFKELIQCGGVRKVDDNIGLLREKCRLGYDRELSVVGGVKVNSADNGAVVTLCNNGADDMTHFAVGACNGHIYHILNIPFAYTARAASSRPVLLIT